MKRILHILKERHSPEALSVIRRQAAQPSHNLSMILIQDAVGLEPDLPVKIYVLEEDGRKRDVPIKFEAIDYPKMLEIILSSDSVVAW